MTYANNIEIDGNILSFETDHELSRNDIAYYIDLLRDQTFKIQTYNKDNVTPLRAEHKQGPQLTMDETCSRLSVNTGSDIIVAALFYLYWYENKEAASNEEIRTEIKKAKGYCKSRYTKNLKQYLRSLQKQGKIQQLANGYSLLQKDKQEAENLFKIA